MACWCLDRHLPDTERPIADERFAFVMLDPDKYRPTLADLETFYPRMSPGGYRFMHDYNSPESDFAVSRAAREFLRDKPERPVDIADARGSVLFRKLCCGEPRSTLARVFFAASASAAPLSIWRRQADSEWRIESRLVNRDIKPPDEACGLKRGDPET